MEYVVVGRRPKISIQILGGEMFRGALTVAKFLSLVAGSLSLVLLIKHGWDFGLASILKLVLGFYEAFIHGLLGWAEAPLKVVLGHLRHWIGLDLHLYPYWKHMFVLMWLYFSGIGKAYWVQRRIDGTIFCVVWGGLVALISSVASGTVALDGTAANIMVMAFPIAGFVIFEIGRSIWGAIVMRGGGMLDPGIRSGKITSRLYIFGFRLRQYTLPTAIFGGLALVIGFHFAKTSVYGVEVNPNVLILLSFVVGLILYWFGRGLVLAVSNRQPGESPRQRFFRSGAVQFGILMLTVLAGATLFIALNAGLTLVGL